MALGISRMLLATDFSAASDVALEYATTLAVRFGASLHLLHVIEDPSVAGSWIPELGLATVPPVCAAMIDEAADRLARLRNGLERSGVKVTSEVMVGGPAAVIRDVAAARGCDLVVMGTHGRTGVAHLLLGSIAEKVVRTAPCPVLTVRATAVAVAEGERSRFTPEWLPTD